MFSVDLEYPKDRGEMYDLLRRQLEELVSGERRAVPDLANASALLAGAMKDINWVGFYLARGHELVLGPFQGRPACISIPFGRGVCGTAADRDETLAVKNVHSFSGHIACDSRSNSEIVVPIHSGGKVAAVLDVDSPQKARFDDEDKKGLTGICKVLEEAIDW